MSQKHSLIKSPHLDPQALIPDKVEAFVDHYNHQRYHESLNNVTPSDVYFGRSQAILNKRERIKRKTLEHRRLQHRKLAA
jgi:putative transposase